MSLKLPICVFDAKTGMLCKNCHANLEKGEITEQDVTISKILAKNLKNFLKVKFTSSIDTNKLVILVGNAKFKAAINKNQKLYQEIENTIQKPIEVVALKPTLKDTFVSLFDPMEVTGIDKIFVPDGTTELKIRLKGNKDDMPMTQDELELIAGKISKSLIRLEFVSTDVPATESTIAY